MLHAEQLLRHRLVRLPRRRLRQLPDYACIGNECQLSVCKENGFDCGTVDNPDSENDEHCGMCSAGLGCLDNRCVPMCVPPDTF